MAVLYRKYRPQTFAEVVGQKPIIDTLKNQIMGGQVSHAYLFTGGRGVGKTSIARIVAKAVNCGQRSKDGNPCGECNVCKQVEQGNFMDLVEIDAASNTGVDNIRDLIEHVKFSPSIGKYKVFIIDEVHMLSKGAFNALLKTLEEPPAHAIFILATTEIQKVPATIISRTQRFDFKSYTSADIVGHLAAVAKQEKLKVGEAVLSVIAKQAEGGMRDALSLLDKVMTLGNDPSMEDVQSLLGVTDIGLSEELFQLVAAGGLTQIPDFFDSLLIRGTDAALFNKDFLEYLRGILVAKATDGDMPEAAETLGLQEIIFITRLFLKALKDLPDAPSPQIPLLLAALEAAARKTPHGVAGENNATPAHTVPAVQKISLPKTGESHMPLAQEADSEKKPERVPAAATAEVAVEPMDAATLEEILPFWPQVIARVKEHNSPLGNLLRSASVLRLEAGRVFVGVKFAFHKQNLENQKNLAVICDEIHKITGKRLGLCAQVMKEEKAPVNLDHSLQDALHIFGGELVE